MIASPKLSDSKILTKNLIFFIIISNTLFLKINPENFSVKNLLG